MIGVDEALALIAALTERTAAEALPLAEAVGRTLAGPVVAPFDAPRRDVSAMDGYAVREADLTALPARLPVAATATPGASDLAPLVPGSCARIFTGGPVPEGADRIVMQEDVERDGDLALFARFPSGVRHIRPRGGDFRAGAALLPAGARLSPQSLVAAAAADLSAVLVHRRPRVVLLATGDELVEPGTARDRRDVIPDSVSPAVAALAARWGAEIVGRRRVRDEPTLLEAAAAEAVNEADLVLVTGGASVGGRDYARAMFAPCGIELLFSKVAMKPGKPVWLGRSGGTLVLGLPGNPTSALVTARLFAAPILARLAGGDLAPALRWRQIDLAGPVPACGDRETFLRARFDEAGLAEILTDQDSGAQRALAAADLLVRRRAGAPALDAGAHVEALDL